MHSSVPCVAGSPDVVIGSQKLVFDVAFPVGATKCPDHCCRTDNCATPADVLHVRKAHCAKTDKLCFHGRQAFDPLRDNYVRINAPCSVRKPHSKSQEREAM